MTIRTAILYDWECQAGMTTRTKKVAEKQYQHTTLAYERQVADDLASEYDVKHGHTAIMERGECINKLKVGVS